MLKIRKFNFNKKESNDFNFLGSAKLKIVWIKITTFFK